MGKERYEAKIEVAPAFDPEDLTAEDLNDDHLQQIADEIAALDSTGDFELEETGPSLIKLDFCPTCARRFIQSPLSPARGKRVSFSKN